MIDPSGQASVFLRYQVRMQGMRFGTSRATATAMQSLGARVMLTYSTQCKPGKSRPAPVHSRSKVKCSPRRWPPGHQLRQRAEQPPRGTPRAAALAAGRAAVRQAAGAGPGGGGPVAGDAANLRPGGEGAGFADHSRGCGMHSKDISLPFCPTTWPATTQPCHLQGQAGPRRACCPACYSSSYPNLFLSKAMLSIRCVRCPPHRTRWPALPAPRSSLGCWRRCRTAPCCPTSATRRSSAPRTARSTRPTASRTAGSGPSGSSCSADSGCPTGTWWRGATRCGLWSQGRRAVPLHVPKPWRPPSSQAGWTCRMR